MKSVLRAASGFSKNNLSKKKKIYYHSLLFFIVIVGLIWYVSKNFEVIQQYSFHFNLFFFILGFLILILSYLTLFFIWYKLSAEFGLNAPFLRAAKAWFLSHLGKYVPGKITILLIRIEAYEGYSKRKVSIITMVENFTFMAANCLLILISLSFTNILIPYYIRLSAIFGLVILIFLIWPPILSRFVKWILKRFDLPQLDEFPPFIQLLKFLISYIVVGFLQGLAFYFVLSSLTNVPLIYYFTITGIYISATIAGLIVFFVPSGIGVKEAILFVILASFLPKPAVIVGTLLFRFLLLSVEILLSLIFYLISKFNLNLN